MAPSSSTGPLLTSSPATASACASRAPTPPNETVKLNAYFAPSTTPSALCCSRLHASMPPPYWAEAFAAATYLLNRHPSASVQHAIPYQLLHQQLLDYSSLRVFGCLCYPNLSATTSHKLSPRSTPCLFLGYPSSHKGYLRAATRRVIVPCHVVFDETVFPFAATPSAASMPSSLDFLMQGLSPPADTPPPAAVECSSAPLPSSKAVLLYYQDLAIIYAGTVQLPDGSQASAQPAPRPGGTGRFGATISGVHDHQRLLCAPSAPGGNPSIPCGVLNTACCASTTFAPGDTTADRQLVSGRPLRLFPLNGLPDSDQLSQRPCRPQLVGCNVSGIRCSPHQQHLAPRTLAPWR